MGRILVPSPTPPPKSPDPTDSPPSRGLCVPADLLFEIRRAEVQAIAPTRSLPAAVGEEVRKVTGQIAEGPGKSPEETAKERARRQVSKATENWVVARAQAMHTWMERTGEAVYEFWNECGLRSKYKDGSGRMVEDALAFWWQNGVSGRVADLWDQIGELRDERDDLARRVYEVTEYRNVYDHQFQLAIEPMARAFLLGLPIPLELADTVLRVAQELADRRARSSPPFVVKLPDD